MAHVGIGGVVCLTGVSSGGHTIESTRARSTGAWCWRTRPWSARSTPTGATTRRPRTRWPRPTAPGWPALVSRRVPLAQWQEALSATRRRQGHHRGQPGVSGAAPSHPHADHAAGDDAAAPVVPAPHTIAPGVLEIDTLLGGWERVTAGYLIEGTGTGAHRDREPVARSRCSWPRSTSSGSGPSDLAGVAVTHIHLDHAGGVGDVARAFPVGHGVRPREGRPPPGRPHPAGRLGGPGLRAAARFPLRPAGPHPRGTHPRAWPTGRRSRSAPTAPWWRSTRPGMPSTMWASTTRRAASSSPATPSASSLPDAGVPAPGHPAAGLRPRPGPALAAEVRGAAAHGHRPGPLRAARVARGRSWPRPTRPCASGPRRPRRPSGTGPTSPRPSRRASTPRCGTSTRRTARSSRP